MDMPYQAAEFLSAKIEEGAIKPNLEVWDLLAYSWVHAKENERAVRALEHAARLAPDGNRYLHIAELLFELRDWNGAVQAVDNALQKGEIKEPGTAHLLLGIASHHRGDEKRSLHALERAQRYKDTKAQADLVDRKAARGGRGGHRQRVASGHVRRCPAAGALSRPWCY